MQILRLYYNIVYNAYMLSIIDEQTSNKILVKYFHRLSIK